MIPPCLFALFLLFPSFRLLCLAFVAPKKTTIDLAMEKFKRFWRLGLSGSPCIEVAFSLSLEAVRVVQGEYMV